MESPPPGWRGTTLCGPPNLAGGFGPEAGGSGPLERTSLVSYLLNRNMVSSGLVRGESRANAELLLGVGDVDDSLFEGIGRSPDVREVPLNESRCEFREEGNALSAEPDVGKAAPMRGLPDHPVELQHGRTNLQTGVVAGPFPVTVESECFRGQIVRPNRNAVDADVDESIQLQCVDGELGHHDELESVLPPPVPHRSQQVDDLLELFRSANIGKHPLDVGVAATTRLQDAIDLHTEDFRLPEVASNATEPILRVLGHIGLLVLLALALAEPGKFMRLEVVEANGNRVGKVDFTQLAEGACECGNRLVPSTFLQDREGVLIQPKPDELGASQRVAGCALSFRLVVGGVGRIRLIDADVSHGLDVGGHLLLVLDLPLPPFEGGLGDPKPDMAVGSVDGRDLPGGKIESPGKADDAGDTLFAANDRRVAGLSPFEGDDRPRTRHERHPVGRRHFGDEDVSLVDQVQQRRVFPRITEDNPNRANCNSWARGLSGAQEGEKRLLGGGLIAHDELLDRDRPSLNDEEFEPTLASFDGSPFDVLRAAVVCFDALADLSERARLLFGELGRIDEVSRNFPRDGCITQRTGACRIPLDEEFLLIVDWRLGQPKVFLDELERVRQAFAAHHGLTETEGGVNGDVVRIAEGCIDHEHDTCHVRVDHDLDDHGHFEIFVAKALSEVLKLELALGICRRVRLRENIVPKLHPIDHRTAFEASCQARSESVQDVLDSANRQERSLLPRKGGISAVFRLRRASHSHFCRLAVRRKLLVVASDAGTQLTWELVLFHRVADGSRALEDFDLVFARNIAELDHLANQIGRKAVAEDLVSEGGDDEAGRNGST